MELPCLIREILFPPPAPDHVRDLLDVGLVQHNQARYHLAIDTYRKAEVVWKEILNDASQPVPQEVDLFFLNAVGSVHESQGSDEAAIEHYRAGIELGDKLPNGHPEGALSYSNLGAIYYHLAQFQNAYDLFRKAKVLREEILGDKHPDTALVYNNFGACCAMLKRPQEALGYFMQAKNIFTDVLGLSHPRCFTVMGNIERIQKVAQVDYPKWEFKKLKPISVPAEVGSAFQKLIDKQKGKKKGKRKGKGKGKGKGKKRR